MTEPEQTEDRNAAPDDGWNHLEDDKREGDTEDDTDRLRKLAQVWNRLPGLSRPTYAARLTRVLDRLDRAEAELARAASPPHTGPTRVEPAQMIAELLTIIAATPPGTPDGDDRRSRLRAAADLLATHLPLAALEPASPTPTEQENDR